MFAKKLIAGILSAVLVATSIPAALVPSDKASAEQTSTPASVELERTDVSNPIGDYYDESGNIRCGADPAILVDGDTVYLYTGHDVAAKVGNYEMTDWLCYSTKDLRSWKYEGAIMSASSISWAEDKTSAWAGQVAKHNDKYYFYYCTWDKNADGKL